MVTDNGGPAFPVNTENAGADGACYPSYGMSLRDYFAAKSISGTRPGSMLTDADVMNIAEGAYRLADAMLKARSA